MIFNKYPYTDFHEMNLDTILKIVKRVMVEVDTLDDWKTEHQAEYEQLKSFCDGLINGVFPPEMEESLTKWIKENSDDIIAELIKMVMFGLTPDGYFVAYIPDSWSDILFGTSGLDDFPAGIDFGHLTLSY